VVFEGWGSRCKGQQSKRGLQKEREGVKRCNGRERRCNTTFVTTVITRVTTILFVRKCMAGRQLIFNSPSRDSVLGAVDLVLATIATSMEMLRNHHLAEDFSVVVDSEWV
jgi:hypothetical protein